MAVKCELVRTQTDEACINNTRHTRVIRTLWCVDRETGEGSERTECDEWVDTGAVCPSNVAPLTAVPA
jgi:hypothetical protein